MKCTLLHPSHKMPMRIGMADYRIEVSMICSQQHRSTMRRISATHALASSPHSREPATEKTITKDHEHAG
jgi:hypothetical protein